ncbi:MAG: hypothetical protein ACYC8T_01200 [Myxococcaceae bacterium]
MPTRPTYPRLVDFRPRKVLAGLGAVMLGAAALAGCGGEDLFPLPNEREVASTLTSVVAPPADAGSDAGPTPPYEENFAGGMPGPDLPDGGWGP